MSSIKRKCVYCSRNAKIVENKKYCTKCHSRMYRECCRCHLPYHSSVYFKLHEKRCDSCHRKNEKAKAKYQKVKEERLKKSHILSEVSEDDLDNQLMKSKKLYPKYTKRNDGNTSDDMNCSDNEDSSSFPTINTLKNKDAERFTKVPRVKTETEDEKINSTSDDNVSDGHDGTTVDDSPPSSADKNTKGGGIIIKDDDHYKISGIIPSRIIFNGMVYARM